MTSVITPCGLKLLALSFVPGIGARTLTRLAMHPFFETTPLEQQGLLLKAAHRCLTDEGLSTARQKAADNVALAEREGVQIVCLLDDDYPPLLRRTSDACPLLFVKGRLQRTNCAAVVGTRQPTPHGLEIARRLAAYFAQRGWSIVSGLALGIDAAAHTRTLEVQGHTVAVLAHGLQTVSPPRHRRLAEEILSAGGALVTEHAFGVEPYPPLFARRDRLQAGLAQGVAVIQTDLTGGSLYACRAAVEYGRPLAVPQPTLTDQAAKEPKILGNLTLLNGGREAEQLLKCSSLNESTIIRLGSKADYIQFETAMMQSLGAETSE